MSRKILDYLKLVPNISAEKSKNILLVNPTTTNERIYAEQSQIRVWSYDET